MYLRAIELAGFKSFAARTRLEFNPGLTAIVGPNGSGKSNLTDAVRWVLGEQSSRTLRGQQMSDLIFSGSSEHRAVGMAEVILLLDNSDYRLPSSHVEIAVARRLFRNGESEYLLNGATCRLRDIIELFTDTGLGRESFAIISQGQIDAILDERPEERRGIFEEAAGIARHRQRKTEAARRLDKVAEQLLRVYDMLAMMRENENTLEVQANEAQRYLNIQQELRHMERSLYYHDILDLEAKLINARVECNEAETGLLQQRAELVALEAEMTLQRQRISDLEAVQQETQQAIWQSRQEQERLLGEQRLLEQRVAQEREQAGQRREEKGRLEQNSARFQRELQALENETSVARWQQAQGAQELDRLQQKLEDAESRLRTVLTAQVEQRSSREEQSRIAVRLEARIEQLRLGCGDTEQQLKAMDEQFCQVVQDSQLAHEDLKLAREAHEGAEAALQELTTTMSHAQSERAAAEARRNVGQRQLDEHKQRLAALQSRARMLSEMEEQREGYQRAVQQLLTARDQGAVELAGLIDVLTRVLEVPADLELAAEAALGSAAQYLVCAAESDAENSIAWLKRRQVGRATFLPLDVRLNRPWSKPNVDETTPGFIGLAGDLVGCEERFRGLVERQLGRIIVMQDLASALSYARKTGYRERIVTLEGDQLFAGGSLSGGSTARRDASLLARPRLLQELQQEQVELREHLEHAEREIRKLVEAVEQCKEREATLHRGEVQLERALAQAQELTRSREREATQASTRHAKVEAERQQIEFRLIEQQQMVAQLLQQLPDVQRQHDESNVDGQQLQREYEGLREEQRTIIEARSALQAKLEQAEQNYGRSLQHLQTLRQQHVADTEQIEVLDDLIAKQSQGEQEYRQLALDLEELLLQAEEAQIAKEGILRGLMVTRGDLATSIAAQDQKLNSLRRAEERGNRRAGESRLRLTRLEDEQEYLRRRLHEEHQLAPEQLLEESDTSLWRQYLEHQPLDLVEAMMSLKNDEQVTERRILLRDWLQERRSAILEGMQRLRQELAAFGPVNLTAIDEVRLMHERVQQLTEQSADLEHAGVELRQLIADLEKLMGQQFRQTIIQVGVEFRQLFQQLFNGGEADLSLENPDRPLEGGVQIHARLPGKRQSSLVLFSGGERALTALALLLAITRVKAPPFCLLDEVETALDEENLERLAALLTHLSTACQIMVITHRRPTMEVADALVGITMQTRGVSTALAVNLNQVEST